MWAAVKSRLHTPIKIFPFGEGAEEVMLYGTVAYTLKDERKAHVRHSNLSHSLWLNRVIVLMEMGCRSTGLRERVW
jgi:hypothetical protein